MKDNIAIIGFMGSGKTTVGKIIAERFNYIFFDIDRIIELSEGRPIKKIFEENGESFFRNIESKTIKKIINNKYCVFACGGGVILKDDNMKLLSKKCIIVYLMISPSEAVKRLSGSNERPLVPENNREASIFGILKTRSKLYSKYSEITINNDNISPDAAAELIIGKIKQKDHS